MLAVRNLGKKYARRWLFRNVEIDLEVGDCLTVIGPNGSGKSTFLKCLVGLVDPTVGTVSWNAEYGYSALDLAVYPALTAREHLELAGQLRGIPANVTPLLERVGLSYAANQLAGEFSTGMAHRLKLAMALQGEPKCLLLDEPGAGLDQNGRDLIAGIIEERLSSGSVVLATNDPLEYEFGTLTLTFPM